MSFITKLKNKILFARQISILKYIKYNYFTKNVVRDKNVYIIPYKGARIDLSPTSRLHITGNNLEIGTNKIKGSKAETYIRMKENSVWKCNNGGRMMYGSTIEIHEKALFETGFFQMNTSTIVVCTKHIVMGNDVWMGRDIVVYDSDYHRIEDENGNHKNYTKPVVIGDHVWLTNHIMIMKGVKIGSGSVVSPYSVIRKDIQEKSSVVNGMQVKVISDNIYWSSKRVPDWGYEKI